MDDLDCGAASPFSQKAETKQQKQRATIKVKRLLVGFCSSKSPVSLAKNNMGSALLD
jgi:hypothetical protein